MEWQKTHWPGTKNHIPIFFAMTPCRVLLHHRPERVEEDASMRVPIVVADRGAGLPRPPFPVEWMPVISQGADHTQETERFA